MLNLHNELKFGNLKLKSRPSDLNGFENLSGTASSITNDDDGKLKDMNLENGMGSADAPFTFIWAQRQGIYKVILYAKKADVSIADWQVLVKDTTSTKSDGQSNEKDIETPCQKDNPKSDGQDTFEFICEERLAATEVIIKWAGSSPEDLAEVVVVGKTWETFPCGLGYFQATDGTHSDTGGSGCKICEDGSHDARTSYAADTAASAKSCTECDNSQKKIYYTNSDDHKKGNTCQTCTVPNVIDSSDKGTCVKCSQGHEYFAEGDDADCNYPPSPTRTTATAVAVTDPSKCTKVECKACPAGSHNPSGSSNYCSHCSPAKMYTDDNIRCTECPKGQVGDTTKNECKKCVAGTKRAAGENECLACNSGWMSTEGAEACTQCLAGTKEVSKTKCDPCEAGTFQDEAGKDACDACDAGTKSAAGATGCTDCPEGQYEDGRTACRDCPVGTYNDSPKQSGLSSCTECADGSVATTVGSVTCTQCSAGSYEKGKDQVCVECEKGKVQPAAGKQSCTDCPDGEVPNDTRTVCVKCQPGYKEVGDECVKCPAGEFQNEEGQTTCKTCAAGSVSETGAAACTPCEKGKKEDTSTNECVDCNAGEYQNEGGKDTCKPCETGYKSAAGAEICTQCEEGTKEVGKTSCVPCDAGTYQDAAGTDTCKPCPEGKISAAEASECTACLKGEEPNPVKTECVACVAGKYQDTVGGGPCDVCAVGEFTSTAGQEICAKCEKGYYQNAEGQTQCKKCEVGYHQNSEGESQCIQCLEGTIAKDEGTVDCTACDLGQTSNADRTECKDCVAGQKQDLAEGGPCVDCLPGYYSGVDKSSSCTPCELGHYQSLEKSSSCLKCDEGTYADVEALSECKKCRAGHVTRVKGLAKCESCKPGEKANKAESATDCVKCGKGEYQDQTGQMSCKLCEKNFFSDEDGMKECKRCADNYYADEGASQCKQCPPGDPDTIKKEMEDQGIDEVLIEKCRSDKGEGCASQTFKNQYGVFELNWTKEDDEPTSFDCEHDPGRKAVFTCKRDKKNELHMYFEPVYYCQKTAKTNDIEKLANETKTNEEKTEALEDLTEDTATNGLGDVAAVSDVLTSMGISAEAPGDTDQPQEELNKETTQSIVNSVSNLVRSDLKIADDDTETKAASGIAGSVVNQMVNVAKMTEVKNEIVTSDQVAIVDIKKDSGNTPAKKTGLVSFTVPKDKQGDNDLKNCQLGSAEENEKENTILLIETKKGEDNEDVDMAIVLITDSTLMPDTKISVVKTEEDDPDTVNKILEDLQDEIESAATEDGGEVKKTYVNSFITEVKVENQPEEDFQLNLYMKPNIDIGNTNTSLKTETDGKRVQVLYVCARYNVEMASWEPDCDTIYDSARPAEGVLCLCNHNTSFAVLMSAYEIDRGYAEVQSYLTYVLLALSTVGLLLTLICLLPAKALRSTRSAKINICFTIALLLASLMFLIQDAFIKADDSGVIKLKSTGCAVYAMIQHYLWLVVFVWMVVEGFLMYLSLVQVFGSHISKYMLKFNLAAWGIPLPIPFIGYFVFTKQHTVGSFTFTDHGYLADTMCFIRPESIPFYALFLAPIVLVILINLVFFALVAKVIKNSKSSGNISDQEQILRQLKAAVGVMVLLGTGWFFGIFMSFPAPQFQVGMQYLFILLNSTQGVFVFLFYIVLNDQVKSHWLVKMGLQEEKRTTTSSSAAAGKSAATKATAVSVSATPNQADNIYENAAASNEDHTYASAEYATASDKAGKHEFPAKSDNNANI